MIFSFEEDNLMDYQNNKNRDLKRTVKASKFKFEHFKKKSCIPWKRLEESPLNSLADTIRSAVRFLTAIWPFFLIKRRSFKNSRSYFASLYEVHSKISIMKFIPWSSYQDQDHGRHRLKLQIGKGVSRCREFQDAPAACSMSLEDIFHWEGLSANARCLLLKFRDNNHKTKISSWQNGLD